MKSKKIALCSSALFFEDCIQIGRRLEKMDFKILYPSTALIMEKSNNYNVEDYKSWFADPNDYYKKAELIKGHFNKIVESDAILVINKEKHGKPGYIGGNTLMEMGISFHFKKPIFVLENPDKSSIFYEEIFGMLPKIINNDLSKIKF